MGDDRLNWQANSRIRAGTHPAFGSPTPEQAEMSKAGL